MRVKDRQKRAKVAFNKPLTTHLTRDKAIFRAVTGPVNQGCSWSMATMLRDVVVRGRRRAHAPAIHAASHVDHEKRDISMHACGSVLMGMIRYQREEIC